MDELGAITAKYMRDHPPTDIRNEFLPFLVQMRATSLPPEEAVPFMKEALQQYLKDHGKDDHYWTLLSVVGEIFVTLGMKHQASKIFRKIKQTDQTTDSTVSLHGPIRFRPYLQWLISLFSISGLEHASNLSAKREFESSHYSRPRQQFREIVSLKSSSTFPLDQRSSNENIMRKNICEISPISVLR